MANAAVFDLDKHIAMAQAQGGNGATRANYLGGIRIAPSSRNWWPLI
jgi:hypothetical protein